LAQRAFRQALAQTAGAPTLIAGCLPVYAVLLAQRGKTDAAVEALALADQHPGWLQHWPLVTRLQAELEDVLGGQAFQAARSRGQTHSLETIYTTMQTFCD
jgi:hypothetical protein